MAVKVNTEKLKRRQGGKLSQQFFVVAISIVVVIAVVIVNLVSSQALRDTVNIVVFKSAVAKDGIIQESNLAQYAMVRAEYENFGIIKMANNETRRTVVLWEDRSVIVNAYASHYIRQGTPIYWDSLTKETPRKNSYLYQMDGELLNVEINADDFGELLVPGDKLNIRVSYMDSEYTLPTEDEFLMSYQGYGAVTPPKGMERQELLFNEARILDMLNSSGESIFDIYLNFIALPKKEQTALAATDEFVKSVKPSKFLLAVTAEEADHYMRIVSKSPRMLVTLLPRTGSNLILESLNELQIGTGR